MERKAIVLAGDVSACAPSSGANSARPALQVANRPIIVHALEALSAAGAGEIYLVGTDPTLAMLRSSIEDDGTTCAPAVTYLTWDGKGDVLAMLALAAPYTGRSCCLIHAADGIAGQPLAPLADLVRPDCPDVVLRLNGSSRRQVWDQAASRILRSSDVAGVSFDDAFAGVCFLGPGALELACNPEGSSERDLVGLAERVDASGGRVHAASVAWLRYKGAPGDL